ncbi:phasin family protein [Zavarzinia sp. CC-PAN008]|uniref:phasin family protein n=1 Tax=Zavarzinia sp. CC-PAN008 TaxID=3243332 RepID=UPI003F7432D0
MSTTAEQIEASLKAQATNAQDALGKGISMAKTRYDELARISKDNVDAVMQSNTAAIKAIESLSAELVAFSKNSLEDSLAATKAIMSAKSMQQVIELQTDYTKSALDAFLAQSTRIGELLMSLSKDTAAPLNARLNAGLARAVQAKAA